MLLIDAAGRQHRPIVARARSGRLRVRKRNLPLFGDPSVKTGSVLVAQPSEGGVVSVRRQRDALVGEIHRVADHLPGDPIRLSVSAAL